MRALASLLFWAGLAASVSMPHQPAQREHPLLLPAAAAAVDVVDDECDAHSDCDLGQFCSTASLCTACSAISPGVCTAVPYRGCCNTTFIQQCPQNPFGCRARQAATGGAVSVGQSGLDYAVAVGLPLLQDALLSGEMVVPDMAVGPYLTVTAVLEDWSVEVLSLGRATVTPDGDDILVRDKLQFLCASAAIIPPKTDASARGAAAGGHHRRRHQAPVRLHPGRPLAADLHRLGHLRDQQLLQLRPDPDLARLQPLHRRARGHGGRLGLQRRVLPHRHQRHVVRLGRRPAGACI